MATYAVGDVQGCFNSLQRLLDSAGFDPQRDKLWVAGDLVNRGPDSLAALRFIKNLDASAIMVLGNHDLHLLAVAEGLRTSNRKDTLEDILQAPDRGPLLEWLRHRPLLHSGSGFTMTHAGLPPPWDHTQASGYAREVEAVLQGPAYRDFLAEMYGDQPDTWHDNLVGMARLRLITNYFTRLRFCDGEGRLDLKAKEGADKPPAGMAPWFEHPHRGLDQPVLFGHWAALNGVTSHTNAIALDTGCVWGNQLSMLRLEDRRFFRVTGELAR